MMILKLGCSSYFMMPAPINQSISVEEKNIPSYSNVVLRNVCDGFGARK